MEAETTNEKQDSIKLVKNSKGYTWEIKRYYEHADTKPETIIEQLQEIDKKMQEKFGGKDEQ